MAGISAKQKKQNLALLDQCITTLNERACTDLRAKAMGPSSPKRCRDKAGKLNRSERAHLERLGLACARGKLFKTTSTRRACASLKAYTLSFCPEAFPGKNPSQVDPPSDQTVINIERTTHVLNSPLYKAYRALGMVGALAGAYHGYKRNESVGWAVGWGFFGSILPFVALPVAYFQGFGKREKRR